VGGNYAVYVCSRVKDLRGAAPYLEDPRTQPPRHQSHDFTFSLAKLLCVTSEAHFCAKWRMQNTSPSSCTPQPRSSLCGNGRAATREEAINSRRRHEHKSVLTEPCRLLSCVHMLLSSLLEFRILCPPYRCTRFVRYLTSIRHLRVELQVDLRICLARNADR
jgi:hypothetical protein